MKKIPATAGASGHDSSPLSWQFNNTEPRQRRLSQPPFAAHGALRSVREGKFFRRTNVPVSDMLPPRLYVKPRLEQASQLMMLIGANQKVFPVAKGDWLRSPTLRVAWPVALRHVGRTGFSKRGQQRKCIPRCASPTALTMQPHPWPSRIAQQTGGRSTCVVCVVRRHARKV